MTYNELLDILAAWASILTAAVALLANAVFRFERYAKRRRLEKYLKAEKARSVDKGQRTLTHLVANVGMPESDILDCAFRSRNVVRTVDVKDGKAVGLFLEFEP